MIKRLDLNEIKDVYRTLMTKDFSRYERRPFHLIKSLYRKGNYACIVLEDEQQVIAYAAFIVDDTKNSVLLDYFAVDKNQRGSGVGSLFLSQLTEYWTEKSGIIIECEAPDSAQTDSEKTICNRRIDFYIRGGAENTSVRWRMFGGEYKVLWLPINTNLARPDVACDLAGLYSLSLLPPLRPLFIRKKLKQAES